MTKTKLKRVLLAVPDDDFVYTETVGGARELEHCATLSSKDEVLPAARQCRPDVVVLSPELEGEIDLLDVVEGLLDIGVRIVFLAGSLTPDNPTVERISIKVRDILYGTPTAGVLLERILSPGEPTVLPESINLTPEDDENEKQSVRSVLKTAGNTLRQVRRSRRVTGKQTSGIYAVWSPVSAGKTFVAVNLAATIALQGGVEVTLIDASPDLSCCYWTGAPDGEEGLLESIKEPGSALDVAFRPNFVPGLSVLTADPGGEKQPKFTPKQIETLAKTVHARGNVVVIDLPTSFDEAILGLAEVVILVADQDISRLVRIQKLFDELEEKGVLDLDRMALVLSRYVESKWLPAKSAQEATGLTVSALIPEATREVLECTRTGCPAVIVSPELQAAFSEIAGRILFQK